MVSKSKIAGERIMKTLARVLIVASTAILLSGCGGSSSSTTASTAGVTGIAVPGSVSTVPAN